MLYNGLWCKQFVYKMNVLLIKIYKLNLNTFNIVNI